MKRYILSILILFSIVSTAAAKITFSNLDLNGNDELLFTVSNETTGLSKYNALFTCKIVDGSPSAAPRLISYYPERMEMLDKGKYLKVRNSYGVAKYDTLTGVFRWETTISEIPEKPLPLVPNSYSYDGAWYCCLEQTSFVTANLVLKNSAGNFSKILCEDVQMSYEEVPVKWSSEKNILLYEKNGIVYFCNPEAVAKGVEIDEIYRKIGRGTINSVEFSSSKYIAYIDDYLLYKINTKELYTMGLYAGIIGQGTVVGRLPFKFNALTDKFSPDKDVSGVVIVQNKRMFSYLESHKDSNDYMDIIYSRPYTDATASLIGSKILWDKSDNPILWMEKLPYDGNKMRSSVYKLSTVAMQVLEIEDSGTPIVSPDGSKVAFFAGAAMYVYNINNWSRLNELAGEKIVSALWADSRTLFVGGEKSIRKWNPFTNVTDVIALSSVNAAYWDGSENRIVADNGSGNNYELLKDTNTWKKLGLAARRQGSTQNGRYRAFIGNSVNCNYENAVYVRTLGKDPVTKSLYKETSKRKNPPKPVALVFDAYDNADGLAPILKTLKKYNVKGDFFINGEFIRRYPLETQQIVQNGYNCNSMFFSQTNLTENTFIIDEAFVRRGLARNEDEFYQCTGRELHLYWHAPYYESSEDIRNYGSNAGYNYVDLSSEAKVSDDKNPFALIQTYYDSVVINKGGIIPVTIGYSQYKDSDCLYNYLDLLICALLDGGFELVGLNRL